MTQSDSPDFEFDISDLEVDGVDAATSRDGGAASSDPAAGSVESGSQESDSERDANELESKSSPGDDGLGGFAFDQMPDAFSAAAAGGSESPGPATEGAAEPKAEAPGAEEASQVEDSSGRVSRIDEEARSLRELGDDDLGADVFSEVDEADGSESFADVIDDLMEEVEGYEAGGFVDLDEEAATAEAGQSSDFFNLEDPDDSLGKSVDPNAGAEADASPAPSFPSPPMNFEIPADPEPESGAPVENDAAEPEAANDPESASDSKAPADATEDWEIPADPVAATETPTDEATEPDDGVAEDPIASERDESEPNAALAESGESEMPVAPPVDENEEERDGAADELESKEASAEAPAAEEVEETSPLESGETEVVLPPEESEELEAAQVEEEEGIESAEIEDDAEADPDNAEADADNAEADPDNAEADADNAEADPDDAEADADDAEADADEGVAEAESPVEAEQAASEAAAEAMPSAEELLKRAGSLFNKDEGEPSGGASAILDEIEEAADGDEELDEEAEEVVAMPAPTEMMAEAAAEPEEAADEDEGVFSMPDPEGMMAEASERGSDAEAESEDEGAAAAVEEEVASSPGNVADRGGDLPPPPPAPVEIIDEEPPEEDEAAPAPEVDEPADEEPASPDDAGDEAFRDPFASEISLDDFNDSLSELDGLDETEVEEADMFGVSQDAWASGSELTLGGNDSARTAELPKPTLFWRLTHSLAIAAGIVLIGASVLLYTWKQEIMEHFEGRDLDGSALITQIRKLGGHALADFNEDGLYRMQWMDSEVRRVTENEIRIHALIGAQLREDLYTPVLESDLKDRLGRTEDELLSALSLAHSSFPEEIGNYPDKPWDALYRISAAREDTLPLRVTYGLTRANRDSDWELSRVTVSGRGGELVWHEGNPRHSYGENAYDVDSKEFAAALRAYRGEAERYVAQISQLQQEQDERLASAHRENEQRRERVADSLTQGAFFSGLAILGEDAAATRDVRLVITESRDRGAFVKGVFKTGEADGGAVKHFVGSLAFEESPRGLPQGVLKVTTVAIDATGSQEAESNFFDPNTVSRIRLLTDGFQLEGDTRGFSLRLTRNQ